MNAAPKVDPTELADGCSSCLAALLSALARGRRDVACTDPACGAKYFLPATPEPVRTKRTTVPAPAPKPARVREFVDALLRWQSDVAGVEREAKGAASPLLGVIAVLETGVLGTGCRGTKGVGRAPREDREPRTVDPRDAARYRALGREHQAAADAIIEDGQGDHDVELHLGGEPVWLTLAQRVGWRIASHKQREKWLAKIVARDARPALTGMTTLGDAALSEAAHAWFAAQNTGI